MHALRRHPENAADARPEPAPDSRRSRPDMPLISIPMPAAAMPLPTAFTVLLR